MKSNTTFCKICKCSINAGKQGKRKFCDLCKYQHDKQRDKSFYIAHARELITKQLDYQECKKTISELGKILNMTKENN